MTADPRLRAATPADAAAILVVHVAAIVAHGPSAYTDRQVAAWAAKTEGTARYEDAAEDPQTDLVVAESDDRIVGFGELDLADGEVGAVFVDPEHGGEGIGSALLARFERRLREAGVDCVRLRAVRNAVGFYEHHGYEAVERLLAYSALYLLLGVALLIRRRHQLPAVAAEVRRQATGGATDAERPDPG